MNRALKWWVRLPEDRKMAYVALLVVAAVLLAAATGAHAGNPFTDVQQTTAPAQDAPTWADRGEALVLRLLEHGWVGVGMAGVLVAGLLGIVYLRFTPHGKRLNEKTNAALKPWSPEEREILEYLVKNERARRAHGE